jgi:(p)ppGpp synthase/HD superfamily hydrolase
LPSSPTTLPPPPQLTDRFFAAAALANEVHGHHRRLGTQVPYAAHLMIVAGLVLEDGGDETQAIAASVGEDVAQLVVTEGASLRGLAMAGALRIA